MAPTKRKAFGLHSGPLTNSNGKNSRWTRGTGMPSTCKNPPQIWRRLSRAGTGKYRRATTHRHATTSFSLADTAHETKTTSDYSACTTWGIWYNNEDKNNPNLILLDAFKDRLAFPDLKQEALKQYKEWNPDAFIVRKKGGGWPVDSRATAYGNTSARVHTVGVVTTKWSG